MDAGFPPPRPDGAPPPRPDLATPAARPGGPAPTSDTPTRREPWARAPRPVTRRRRSGLVAVAVLLTLALIVAAVGSIGGGALPVGHLATSGGEYRFLHETPDGMPYRWDPCIPIHYEVNLGAAPPAALAEVREAVGRVAQASGYRFVYVGTTVRTADQQIETAFQTGDTTTRWLPLLITWIPHPHFDYLADTHRAAAFGMPKTGDGDRHTLYESGLVAIDAGGDLPPGFASRYSEGVVLMHELGHIMGLAHVGDADELMWSSDVEGGDPHPNLAVNDWGPGDRRGLEALAEGVVC